MKPFPDLPPPPADAVELSVRDTLPDVGDRLYVYDPPSERWLPCTVITMGRCQQLSPNLWGWAGLTIDPTTPYTPDETIRAFEYDEASRPASFCIMRFRQTPPPGHYYNYNVRRIG